jgi:hypothetical protein
MPKCQGKVQNQAILPLLRGIDCLWQDGYYIKKIETGAVFQACLSNGYYKEDTMRIKQEEPISYARRILITFTENRIFRGKLKSWGIKDNDVNHIYKMAQGERTPTFWAVFSLRENISPELWYYGEKEPLPDPIKKNFIYPSKGKKSTIKKIIMGSETIAVGKIKQILEKRELSEFCRIHKVSYQDLRGCCIKQKDANGKYNYHARPSYTMIKVLRDEIHPSLWYLFNGET